MIGRGITWGDVFALFAHLPHDSHTLKLMDPKGFREGELKKMSSQIGGEIVDAVNTLAALTRGVPAENISQMPSAIEIWSGNIHQNKQSAEPGGKPVKQKPRGMTPAESRAAIAARETPRSATT